MKKHHRRGKRILSLSFFFFLMSRTGVRAASAKAASVDSFVVKKSEEKKKEKSLNSLHYGLLLLPISKRGWRRREPSKPATMTVTWAWCPDVMDRTHLLWHWQVNSLPMPVMKNEEKEDCRSTGKKHKKEEKDKKRKMRQWAILFVHTHSLTDWVWLAWSAVGCKERERELSKDNCQEERSWSEDETASSAAALGIPVTLREWRSIAPASECIEAFSLPFLRQRELQWPDCARERRPGSRLPLSAFLLFIVLSSSLGWSLPTYWSDRHRFVHLTTSDDGDSGCILHCLWDVPSHGFLLLLFSPLVQVGGYWNWNCGGGGGGGGWALFR